MDVMWTNTHMHLPFIYSLRCTVPHNFIQVCNPLVWFGKGRGGFVPSPPLFRIIIELRQFETSWEFGWLIAKLVCLLYCIPSSLNYKIAAMSLQQVFNIDKSEASDRKQRVSFSYRQANPSLLSSSLSSELLVKQTRTFIFKLCAFYVLKQSNEKP